MFDQINAFFVSIKDFKNIKNLTDPKLLNFRVFNKMQNILCMFLVCSTAAAKIPIRV